MRYRPFGATGLVVSEVGLGCARLGGVFETLSRPDQIRILRRSLDEGVTFFDTADSYSQGESERLLGEALGSRRQGVVVATKVGYCPPIQRRLGGLIKPLLRPLVRRLGLRRARLPSVLVSPPTQDFSPAYVVRAAEQSLRRLGTNYIDIYQLHSPPSSVISGGEWVEPLERLRRDGKIRSYGIACERTEDGLAALEHGTISAIQVGASLLEQGAIDRLIPEAGTAGVGIIARQPFAAGFLTRPLDRLDLLKDSDEAWPAERARIDAFRALATREGLSSAALALRFVQSIRGVSAVLMGISDAEQLATNLRLSEEGPLPPNLFDQARAIMARPTG